MESARNNFQLGSLSVEDQASSYEVAVQLGVAEGGTGAVEIEGVAMRSLQLGAFASKDALHLYDLSFMVPFSLGGTGADNLETAALASFQAGRVRLRGRPDACTT